MKTFPWTNETYVNPKLNNFEGFNLSQWVDKFLPSEGATCFMTLDGSDVAKFCEAMGHKVVSFKDTGRCGLVITEDGYRVSTNGHVSRA